MADIRVLVLQRCAVLLGAVLARFKDIAVLINLSRPYDRQVIRGITRYVHTRARWRLYVEENPADKIPSFKSWSGDGLIVDLDDSRIADTVSHFRGATVGIGAVDPDILGRLGISTVRSNDQQIAEWAADHLIDKGLKYFAYCGTLTRGLDLWVRLRRDAFLRRIEKQGHRCFVFTGRRYAPRNWSLMQAELMRWLQELPRPIGIMACNDLRGRHILDACRQLNLRVPEDVAVVGVDNDELMCELAVPPLSSVAQGSERLGYEAAKLLDRLIRGRRPRPKHIVVPPISVVHRRSSDLIAVDDPLLSAALRFIQNHAAEQIGVPDVVRDAGVSRSTLETRFKKKLSRTIHDEIQRVRIETARRLLTATNLSLSKIAEQAGYRNAFYMSAVFRRELGMPPRRLRQEAGIGLWQ